MGPGWRKLLQQPAVGGAMDAGCFPQPLVPEGTLTRGRVTRQQDSVPGVPRTPSAVTV